MLHLLLTSSFFEIRSHSECGRVGSTVERVGHTDAGLASASSLPRVLHEAKVLQVFP
jgi:hypothetical protein